MSESLVVMLCNLLNGLQEVDPLLVQQTVNTLWKAHDMHPDVEYIQAGDSYMTSMMGIVNGALRPSGVRIALNSIGDSLVFVPEKVEIVDATNPEEA